VIDTGPGIPAPQLSRVFEPMFTTRGHRGHRGLGLTIAHTIVRDHGGTLTVESISEEGTTAIVRLPALSTDRDVPDAMRASGADMAASASDRVGEPLAGEASASARRILLIEDEDTLRMAVQRYLTKKGYTVDSVDNGAAALECVAAAEYDLVLLDLRMRGLSGEDVYDTLQTSFSSQASRVVFMTGDLHSASASRFIRLSGRPVIAKPFTLADMEARVGALLAAVNSTLR
jgi:CheY-like chemotaxis protein